MQESERTKKKVPERRCIGCGEGKPKKDLVRIVRKPDGTVSVDLTSKMSGRGAYICHNISCLKKARRAKRLEKNLGVVISDEVFDELETGINSDGHQN